MQLVYLQENVQTFSGIFRKRDDYNHMCFLKESHEVILLSLIKQRNYSFLPLHERIFTFFNCIVEIYLLIDFIRGFCYTFFIITSDDCIFCRSLKRKDLRVLANCSCPDLERKTSNASKRLRDHFNIPEGEVKTVFFFL